ncbi:MAG: hypothetical protein Q8O67_06110 [Deltaproteobacteria bacterium]|nr:hypothetical protein [Deltaproteobacteria bacterium]
MKSWNVVVVVALLCAALLSGCAASGFELQLSLATRGAIDQLAVSGDVEGDAAFDPTLLPAEARDLMSRTDETLTVIVDDEFAGDVVDLTLVGLRRGFPRATGSASVELHRGEITVVEVRLGAESLDDS